MKASDIRRYIYLAWPNIIGYCSLNGSGLYEGCSLWSRIVYPFEHVNIWHFLANMWCMFVIVKSDFKESLFTWGLGYLIAISAPAMATRTVGFSGVLYAVLGIISWQAANLLKFHAWTIGFLLIMFLIPGKVNNSLHVYCYAIGILAGALINFYEDRRKRYN